MDGAKDRARLDMKQNKPSVYIVSAVSTVIVGVLGILDESLGFSIEEVQILNDLIFQGHIAKASAYFEGLIPSFSEVAIGFLIWIMSNMISIGFAIYCLNVVRGKNAVMGNLFDGFSNFIRFIALRILMSFFVFLWSLLLFIPGVIAAYRYSMATYILIDEPTLSPFEAIRRSKKIMHGYKLDLFVLQLSFVGWFILATFATLFPPLGLVISLVATVYLSIYLQLTMSHYYCALTYPQQESNY